MAEEQQQHSVEEVVKDVSDRGIFDFLGKKEDQAEKDFQEEHQEKKSPEDEKLVSEFEKVKVTEPEKVKEEEDKLKEKHSSTEKLNRSHSSSSSSSSSDEEEAGGEGENKEKKKKKKGLKEQIKDGEKKGTVEEKPQHVVTATGAEEDNDVTVEKVEVDTPEEKKGFIEKIKDKLPGQHKKPAEEPAAADQVVENGKEHEEKKGLLEKIMDKIPGYNKTSGEEKDKDAGVATH